MFDFRTIDLSKDSVKLFCDQPEQWSLQLAGDRNKNKPTQIRRFYDELLVWYEQVFSQTTDDLQKKKFDEVLPYVQMIRARLAYALGRGTITKDFSDPMTELIRKIQDKDSLKRAKLFMEAFIGFNKANSR